jgi:hypothetical protein
MNKAQIYFKSLFQKQAQEPEFHEIEAKLPNEGFGGSGVLDIYSGTWRFMEAWAQSHLQEARAKNDNPNRDIIQTSLLRGEIKTLKSILDLAKPPKGLLDTRED